MKLINKMLFAVLICVASYAQAEIESVVVTWRPGSCTLNCPKLLEEKFKKIQGIDQLSVDLAGSQAVIKWKKNARFSYSEFNTALRIVGLSMMDIRLRVRGTLQHTPNTVTLTSLGDGTRFELLNPLTADITNIGGKNNREARRLTPELYQKFLDAQSRGLVAIVEGPLFMPWRNPNDLVAEQVTIVNK